MGEKSERILEAVQILDSRDVNFEYDGEMAADVALNTELMKLYPFCRLSAPANVLVMPALHSANIVSNMLQELGGGSMIGPILSGMELPVQIASMNASVSDIINLAGIAAIDSIDSGRPSDGAKSGDKPSKKASSSAKSSKKTGGKAKNAA